MSKPIKYELGGVSFVGKANLVAYLRNLLKTSKTLDALNTNILLDVIALHPNADQKIGSGVEKIFVDFHFQNKSLGRCFHIKRIDGSVVDVSYKKCLDHYRSNSRSKALKAMRFMVSDQTMAFKQSSFNGSDHAWSDVEQCWLAWDEVHVDHYPVPFIDIAEKYVLSRFAGWDNLPALQGELVTGDLRFADSRVTYDWQTFHAFHAQYRLISAELNVKLGRHSA